MQTMLSRALTFVAVLHAQTHGGRPERTPTQSRAHSSGATANPMNVVRLECATGRAAATLAWTPKGPTESFTRASGAS
eukprot:6155934-Prymnesium_polylepis.1